MDTCEKFSMEPTRTPLGRVVIFVSGISSESSGTFGGMCEGRVGPMEREDDIVYFGGEVDSGLELIPAVLLLRVIKGGSFLSGNSFSDQVCFTVSGDVWAWAAKDRDE